MELNHYRQVHPNWKNIAELSPEEADATLDLLLLSAFIDDKITDEEVETLTQEWLHLPFVGPPENKEALQSDLHSTHNYLVKIADDPSLLDEFLDSRSDKFDDEETKLSVLRLVAIESVSDGLNEDEQELCYAIGHHFDLDFETTEKILDSIWQSHQEAIDAKSGREHHVPPVKGANWARKRSSSPYPNPFEMREA